MCPLCYENGRQSVIRATVMPIHKECMFVMYCWKGGKRRLGGSQLFGAYLEMAFRQQLAQHTFKVESSEQTPRQHCWYVTDIGSQDNGTCMKRSECGDVKQ